MDGSDESLPGDAPYEDAAVQGDATRRERIGALLREQPFAVLCTQGEGQPYGSLVAFAVGPQLRSAAFATPVTTHKYRLLCACPSVALVVDSRSKYPDELMPVEAITATGRAVQLAPGPEFDRWAGLLLRRHPQLVSFVRAPSTALFRVDIARYLHVSRFQQTYHWVIDPDG